jgi:streptomycin 3"-adenylyltransferase
MSRSDPIESYVASVAQALRSVLGDALVGVYLHGSATVGGFHPERSDLDVLAVASRPLTPDEKRAIARCLSEEVLPCPAGGLELSVVTEDSIRNPVRAPRFEVHVATKRWRTFVDGTEYGGDPDLVLHFAVCRVAGRAVAGPPAADLFPELPHSWVLTQMAEELEWAEAHDAWTDGVLNACRNWRYLEEGEIGSKLAGAEWAMERAPDPALINEALARRKRDREGQIDRGRALAFLQETGARLRAAAREEEG